MKISALVLTLLAIANVVNAKELGLNSVVVGQSSCAEAERALAESGSRFDANFTSKVTGGPYISLSRNALDLDFILSGEIVCDTDGIVHSIKAVIPKRLARDISDALAATHTRKSNRLPKLGNGLAKFSSKSGQTLAEVSYVHVSFDAELWMFTPYFATELADWRRKKAEKAKDDLKKTF